MNLSSSIAKLNRAKKHLNDLHISIDRYKGSNPYTSRVEEHPERNEAEIKLSVNVNPPLEEWALIIGDASHNLRSALDHLACTLVKL